MTSLTGNPEKVFESGGLEFYSVPISEAGSPPEAYQKLRELEDTGYTFLLESAETEPSVLGEGSSNPVEDFGRNSYVGFDPAAVVKVGNGEAEVEDLSGRIDLDFGEVAENGVIHEGYDQLDALRAVMESYDGDSGHQPEFMGGLVGFHPYDMVYEIKDFPKDSKVPPFEEIPKSVFVFSDRFLRYDHEEDEVELVLSPEENNAEAAALEADRIVEALSGEAEIDDGLEILSHSAGDGEEYKQMVENVKEHVYKGDIYQGVVSRHEDFKIDGDPLTFYNHLRDEEPTPYMYLIEFGGEGVVGSSPETLSRTYGDTVETNPIAGTVARGTSPVEDRRLAGEMLADDKERAEHSMLVDLGRNDIREVARQGSVSLEDFMSVVMYSTVQHMESTVTGQLRDGEDAFSSMRSIIPAGTLSGAPKKRAMEIVAGQEGEPRGPYGGALGYYSLNGGSDLAIVIRSLMFEEDDGLLDAKIQSGAGIVADSDPQSELEETDQKLGGLRSTIKGVAEGEE